ncbi:MAG: DinB family protein [Rhodothermales bacterium]
MRSLLLTALLAAVMSVPATAQSVADEVSADLDAAFDKLVQLAEAVPADRYDWRPAEGVRSISEAFVHVSSAAYFFGNMGGISMPEELNLQGAEENLTQKDDVIAFIRAAREHIVSEVGGLSEGDLEAPVEWFDGSQRSTRHLMIGLAEHTSEHLGQLIAYARMNDVTPPWSG